MSSGIQSKKNKIRIIGVILIIIAIIIIFIGYSFFKEQANYNLFINFIGVILGLFGGVSIVKPEFSFSIFTFIKNEEHNHGSSLNEANISQSQQGTNNCPQVSVQGDGNTVNLSGGKDENAGFDRDNRDRIIEKAKDIKIGLITPLKSKNTEIIDHFQKKTFIEQDNRSRKISYVVFITSFDKIIRNSEVIHVNDDGTYKLIYIKDEYLNQHFDKLNSSLLIFKTNLEEISSIINEICLMAISEPLEKFTVEMCKSIDRSISDITQGKRIDRLRWILLSYVLGNPKIYRSGRTVLIELLKGKYPEICSFLDGNTQISDLKNRFKNCEEQIVQSTNELKRELNNLTTDWQNNYYI